MNVPRSLLTEMLGRGNSTKPSAGLFGTPEVEHSVVEVETHDGATSLHTRVYGPSGAPVVVLVHGWSARLEYWNPQINALAERNQVIVYDQRGCGRTAAGRAPFSVDMLGDDLAAVLDATVERQQPAVIVGHSMGGISVMSWAGRHPAQARRLAKAVVLAGTGAEGLVADTGVVPLPGKLGGIRQPLVQAALSAPMWLAPLPLRRNIVRNLAMSPSTPTAAVDLCVEVVSSCSDQVRLAWLKALLTVDVSIGAASLTVPTTVISGELDRLIPVKVGRRLADIVEHAGYLDNFTELSGIGHCMNLEVVDAFNAEIERLSLGMGRARGNQQDVG